LEGAKKVFAVQNAMNNRSITLVQQSDTHAASLKLIAQTLQLMYRRLIAPFLSITHIIVE
jgi:hypothetical protein